MAVLRHVVVPAAIVLTTAGMLVHLLRDRTSHGRPTGRYRQVPVLFAVIFARDAVLSSHRSWWDRGWRAAEALLIAATVSVLWWRGRRARHRPVPEP